MLDISYQIKSPKWKKLISASRNSFTAALQLTFDALELSDHEFSVSVSFITDAEIKKLNAQYRHKDKATNVLSFPMIDDFTILNHIPTDMPIELGDIVLAFETVVHEAKMEDKTLEDHVSHLLVHGLLHLFGYDHMNKKDEKEMESLEVSILSEIGISNPYL